jgi:beta-mannosidase
VQTYRVNGVDIFAKGADWVPPDSFEGRVWHGGGGDDDVNVLCSHLQSALDSNMNFIRIWGGGIFPQDEFFDCADRYGILLQQDGIFANRAYPTTKAFLELITTELQYQARRLASHPSLFLWAGSNEEYAGAVGGWWDTIFLDTMFPALRSIDRSRPVWAACPALPWVSGVDAGGLPNGEPFTVLKQSRGMGDRGPHHPLGAETHEYWFSMCDSLANCRNCVDDSFYMETVFASEFGWIGMPSLESLSPYLSAELGDYNMMSPAMVARQNREFPSFCFSVCRGVHFKLRVW